MNSKNKKIKEEKSMESKELEVVNTAANLPAVMDTNDFLEDCDKGFENIGKDDIAIPFIAILQSNSPQVKRGDAHIDGAVEGCIINNVTGRIYNGDEGITVIPCAYEKHFVEWQDREAGGGFCGNHDESILAQTTKDDKGRDRLANGNYIVPTAYHYVVVLHENGQMERCVIPMASTQIKKSRRWNSQMIALQVKIGERIVTPPMFSHKYSLKTVYEENAKGSWFGWSINTPSIIQDRQTYAFAKKFNQDISSGIVKAQTPPTEEIVETNDEALA